MNENENTDWSGQNADNNLKFAREQIVGTGFFVSLVLSYRTYYLGRIGMRMTVNLQGITPILILLQILPKIHPKIESITPYFGQDWKRWDGSTIAPLPALHRDTAAAP